MSIWIFLGLCFMLGMILMLWVRIIVLEEDAQEFRKAIKELKDPFEAIKSPAVREYSKLVHRR